MSAEDVSHLEYDLTIHELQVEREPWLDARTRQTRTAGLDASVNQLFELRNSRMNYLLEELFTKMGRIAVTNETA